MSDTLLQKLRYYSVDKVPRACESLMHEAADEIERLTETLAASEGYLSYERSQVERLRQELEAYQAHPPLLVDGETGKITPLFDAARTAIQLNQARAALHDVGQWLHSAEGIFLPQPLLDQINEALRDVA